mgnify:CR=1 FL=1
MIQVYDKYGKIKSSGIPGFGTVTAVSAGNLSPLFTTVVTSPTSTPNIAFTLTSQTQKLFFASPNSGSGTPTFRAIQASDLPSLSGTYVPVTRNLTINGVTYDLSSDRSWTVAASAVWGGITGTITAQTDLITYLSTNYVPYTGATSNVDLGEWQLKAGQVEFDQTPTGTSGVAKLRWNDTDGTLDLGLKGGNVTLQIGQEEVIRVVNKSGINLLESNYQVTRIRNVAEGGAQGQRLAIVLAQANTKVNHTGVLGLVTENIDNNQEGFITTFGMVRDINTTGSIQGETWVDGDVLWLSETVAGGLTNIEPNTHPVQIGYVVYAHVNNGKIFVSVSGGANELNELHDVTISSPVNNNILSYNSSLQRWENKTISEIDGLSLQSGVSNLEYISNLIHKQNLGWMQPNNGNATYNFLKSSTNINLSGGSGTNSIPARLVYETAATAGGVCFARGLSGGAFNAASNLSFWWSRKFEITSNVANSRFVCALSNQFRLSSPTNVEPTTLINLIGVCKLSTSDNLHFIWNDATGTASTLDLGTNFPANNTTAYTYIFEIYKIFDSTDIVLKLSRIDVNGNVLTTQHTINSDTPTLIMSAVIFGTNNTTASVFSFNDFGTVFKNYERQWDII